MEVACKSRKKARTWLGVCLCAENNGQRKSAAVFRLSGHSSPWRASLPRAACVCAHMCERIVYMCTVHMSVYMHMDWICVSVYMCMCRSMYLCVCTWICACTCAYTHASVQCVCIHGCEHTCVMHMCIYICVHRGTYGVCMCIVCLCLLCTLVCASVHVCKCIQMHVCI